VRVVGPRRRPPFGQGGIYTSLAFGKRATDLGITRSFGSTGEPWIYGTETWATRDLLRSVLFDHLEEFYNPRGPRSDWAIVPQPSTKRVQSLHRVCDAGAS
jgi:transposase InsO family protein